MSIIPVLKSSSEGHLDEINDMCADPYYLYTASDDNTIKIWNKNSFDVVAILPHPDPVYHICNDDSYIYSDGDGYDCSIWIWQKESNKKIAELTGQNGSIESIKVDKNFIYSLSVDHTLKIWDKHTFKEKCTIEGNSTDINTPIYHNIAVDDKYIFSAFDNALRVWDKNSFDKVGSFDCCDKIYSIAVDDTDLFIATKDGNIEIWDKTFKKVVTLTADDYPFYSVIVDEYFIYAVSITKVFIWNKKHWGEISEFTDEDLDICGINVVLPEKDYVYFGGYDGCIKIVGKNSWEVLVTTKAYNKNVAIPESETIEVSDSQAHEASEITNIYRQEAVKTIEAIATEGINYIHVERFEWLKETVLPYLQYLQSLKDLSQYHKELLCYCYYVVGDVYHFNEAYYKAIEIYKKSLEFLPTHAESYREIACMYDLVGESDKAIVNIKKALELYPTDKSALRDMEMIEEGAKNEDEDKHVESDKLLRKCNELIANECFEEVLDLVKNQSSCKYEQIRARCYGALSNCKEYMEIWRKICEQSAEAIEIEYADWYYMPQSVYYNSEIWRLFLAKNDKIEDSKFLCLDFYEYYPDLTTKENREAVSKFRIHTLDRNRDGLLQLSKKYPKWKALADLLV